MLGFGIIYKISINLYIAVLYTLSIKLFLSRPTNANLNLFDLLKNAKIILNIDKLLEYCYPASCSQFLLFDN